jgi:hypothetical protein
MLAINRIGMAMHGLGKVQQQIRDIIVYENKYLMKTDAFRKKRDQYRKDQKSEERSESFGKKEEQQVKDKVVKEKKKELGWLEKIFGPFAGIISFVGRIVITQTVLRWMGDPKNTDKLTVFVKSFTKVFKWAFNIAYKSTDAVLSGFAKVFGSSDKKGLDRFGEVLGGLGQLLIGIAGFKALGYLLNPFSLVNDIIGLVDMLGSGDKSVDIPDATKPSAGKPDPKLKGAQERYFKKYGRDAFIKRFGEEGLKNLPRNMQRTALRQFGRNAKAFGIRTTQKVLGKGVTRALGKIPIVGPVIDFAIRTLIFKEPLGKAAASAVGAGIGQGIGGAIGTAGAAALAGGTFGVGLAAAPIIIGASSLIGGFVGDYIGSKLYDWIAPFFSKDKTPQMAKGGIVTKPTKAIIGEKGPEAVIPLSKLGGFGVAATIVGATQSALSRMGAAGEIAKSLINPELSIAEKIFGTSKVGGGDTLGKSVMKASRGVEEIDAGNDISIYLGTDNVIIKDRKEPGNKPTTLRGQLANVLSALIWVSKKNMTSGGVIGAPGPSSSGDTSGDFSGSANAEKAFNYLKSKGLTAEQAAGLVGNFMQEAGPKIDPKITNSIGHKGIAQWDPRDRWPKLVTFAKSKNLNPESLEAQLQFVWHELDTGSGGLSLRTLKSAKTVQSAAHLFVSMYERSGEKPGHPGYDNRIKYGNQIYNKYAKMAAGGELKKPSSYMSRERRQVIEPQLSKAKQLDKFAAGGAHRVIPDTPSTSWAAGIPLTYVTSSNGKRAEVAVPLAKRFQGFIKELESTGYKINELGGFRPDGPPSGNVDGKGPQYAHPYGAAIDINWTKNPAFVGKRFGDFPRNSGEIAAKYGLGWGSKFDDAMHFSAMKREYGAGIGGQEITGKTLGGSKEGADYKPGSSSTGSIANTTTTEEPETLESLFSKLQTAVSGLNTSLGYTPEKQSPTPTKTPPKLTPTASSTGKQVSDISGQVSRLEEAAKDAENYGQIVPLPINSGMTQIAYGGGTQVYTPKTPITYGI